MNEVLDCIIVGGGPAGMSSALYVGSSFKTMIISEIFGGQLSNTNSIVNFLGFENVSAESFIERCVTQLKNMPLVSIKEAKVSEIRYDLDEKIYYVYIGKNVYKSKTLIYALGSYNIFPKFQTHDINLLPMIYTCALCEIYFMKDKDIIVLGGGNKGFEEAIHLSTVAKTVTIVHHRNEFKAYKNIQKQAFAKSNIFYKKSCTIIDVKFLNSQKTEYCFIGKNYENNSIFEIKADALFVAIGSSPNLFLLEAILKTTNNIKPDNLFYAGDVLMPEIQQAITAAASGAHAGIQCYKYLNS
ncbi:Thioredoxin reductase [bacterium AB1]|nr:Thioredoxin reductase [bacterium AB1]